MRKQTKKEPKKDELVYCKFFGHSLRDGQCVVCKLSSSKVLQDVSRATV